MIQFTHTQHTSYMYLLYCTVQYSIVQYAKLRCGYYHYGRQKIMRGMVRVCVCTGYNVAAGQTSLRVEGGTDTDSDASGTKRHLIEKARTREQVSDQMYDTAHNLTPVRL